MCLSLWQPWATAITLGSKRIETRHWYTPHRGPLAIHAAKRWTLAERALLHEPQWIGALQPVVRDMPFLSLGAIVAVCELVDCRRVESLSDGELHCALLPVWDTEGLHEWSEHDMGNFAPGRFGWMLSNVRSLEVPIPYRGMQGLFDVPDDVFEGHLGD